MAGDSQFKGPVNTANAAMNRIDPRVNDMTNFRGFRATTWKDAKAADDQSQRSMPDTKASSGCDQDSRIGKVRKATKKHMADPARHARNPRNLATPTTRTKC